MAETIRGINVVIQSETTGLSKALSDVEKKSRDIQSELRQVEKLLKLDPSNTELVAQKQKLLSDAIANTREKLDRLRAVQEQVNQQFQRGEISESQYRAFQREIVKTEQQLKSFENKLEQTRQTANKLGDTLKNSFEKIKTVGDKIAIIGTALSTGLGFAVKGAIDFEAQMSKVQALSGSTKEQFEALRQQAIELGASTSFSASQAAEGMQMLAAAGMNADQIMGAMPGVLSAAAASGEDMALVAETMGNALNTFGLKASQASHVADVLAVAANSSAIGVQDMAYMFKYAAPVAAQLGVSLEELGAAAIEMGNAGIKGEQAGTTLRAALLRLVDPPKEAKEMLNQLGVAITDSSGKMLPMSNVIGQLRDKMNGMTEAQKAAALSAIFGTEAVSGMMVLVESGKEKFDQYTQALKNSNGASAETAKVMQNNLKGALDQLKGAMESAAIGIGSALAPAIREIATVISDIIEKFNALPGPVKEIIATFGAMATILTAVIGVISMVGPALAALTGPVGIAVLAISGLVAAGVALYQHWDEVKAKAQELWNKLGEAWEGIKGSIINAANAVLDFLKEWGPLILAAVTGPIGLLVYSIVKHWDDIKAKTTEIWNAVKDFVVGAFQWMYDHNYYFQALVDFIRNAWDTIKNFTTETWNNIKDALTAIWDTIKNAITERWEAIKEVTTSVWTTIKNWLTNLWNNIKNTVMATWNSIMTTITDILNRIKEKFQGLVDSAFDWGKNLLNEFIDGFKSMFGGLDDALESAAQKAADFLGFHSPTKLGPGRDADKWAPNFVEMFAQGIEDSLPRLQGALSEMALSLNVAAGTSPTNNYNYGGNVFHITVQDGEDLIRTLRRMGVAI